MQSKPFFSAPNSYTISSVKLLINKGFFFCLFFYLFSTFSAYSLELSNTLDASQSIAPHRSQFNLMMGFKPQNNLQTMGATFSLHANYLIMRTTYIMIDAPNFFVSSSQGQTYFTNIGLGIRHRFVQIPWSHTHLDIFGTLRFPNQFKILNAGGTLTIDFMGTVWKLEPWLDFIFPTTTAPEISIGFRASASIPIWEWFTINLSISRANGFQSAYFPVAITDHNTVFDYAIFTALSLQLNVNERIIGHVGSAVSFQSLGKNGNFKNILFGIQYLL